MRLYTFYCSDYDYCQEHKLIHPETRSQEQFETDCRNALQAVGATYIKEEQGWVTTENWITAAADFMVQTYGYVQPEHITYGPLRSDIIGHELISWEKCPPESTEACSWREEVEADLAVIRGIIGEELLEAAIAKNRQLAQELDKDLKS